MAPAYGVNDQLIISKLAYLFKKPQRGDIVLLKSPVSDKELIKRLIGLPGEVISVRDKGIGIEQHELQNIFERFYRTPGAKTQDSRGSGLGLAIVKSIMKLHNGAIAAQSKPADGTTMYLRFPPQ